MKKGADSTGMVI